jgi:hypothetical protein
LRPFKKQKIVQREEKIEIKKDSRIKRERRNL